MPPMLERMLMGEMEGSLAEEYLGLIEGQGPLSADALNSPAFQFQLRHSAHTLKTFQTASEGHQSRAEQSPSQALPVTCAGQPPSQNNTRTREQNALTWRPLGRCGDRFRVV